jgi:Hint domain/Bacterial Ig domain
MATASELPIQTNASAMDMASEIFGDGVTVVDATYSGDNRSSGIWSDGDSVSGDVTPGDTGVILSTGRVSNFTNSSGDPNVRSNTSSNTSGVNNDPDFNAAAGQQTYDAAILEADFIPTTDYISIQFTFASEEYPEYVDSIFNDAVGIWINGELVESPIFQIAQINNVNGNSNATLFQDNTNDSANTEMDGYTVTLTVKMAVNNGVVNTIKLGIADVADSSYDSAILIAGDSLQGEVLAWDDAQTVLEGQTTTVDVLANDDYINTMVITQINGQDVSVGDTITLDNGFEVTLLASGALEVVPPVGYGGLTGPDAFNFTYTAADGAITDTAFVTITSIPCFAAGTHIRTTRGEVRVEDLEPGDLIETRDHGPQPLRWIGRRRMAATGKFAPVVIERGTLGLHETLVLSPQHRVLIRHHMAELLFGEDEVLVAVKDLVNECSIHIREGGEVEYFHLLFDSHQMIWSEGLLTESFQPGPQTLPGFDDAVQAELFSLFPQLDPATGQGYSAAARPSLRSFEARALLG